MDQPKNSKRKKTLVTFVEDPYQIKTHEISEAQNEADELQFESEDHSFSDDESTENEETQDDTSLHREDEPESDRKHKRTQEASPDQDSPLSFEVSDSSEENESEDALDPSRIQDIEDDELQIPPADEDFLARLDQLAKAIEKEVEKIEEDRSSTPAIEEPDLAAQIAEDQALELENERQQVESIEEEATASTEVQMDLEEIQSSIEAILFIADKPIPLKRFHDLIGPHFELSQFEEAIQEIQKRYQSVYHGFELVEVAGGYQFRTKPGRSHLAQKLVKVQTQKLSSGSMETLAIIAYRQPVMKEEIDQIRGVDSSYFIRGLMEKKLIQISGRSELPGRPILYSTTPEFMEIFGLKDMSALPPLRELEQMIPASQSGNPEDEDPRIKNMRRLVNEMKSDKSTSLQYNPKEDEKILKEFRERVNAIPSSTPYLDEVKAAELLAKQQEQERQNQAKQQQQELALSDSEKNP